MAVADRERWNARHAEKAERAPHSPFLDELDDLLPRRGRALDAAGGAGRNALWLARRGLTVTLADVSDVALHLASRAAGEAGLPLDAVQTDLEAEPLPA